MRILKNKLNSKLYYIFFSCFILYWFINLIFANVKTDLSIFKNILIVFGVISFIFMYVNTKFTKGELVLQIFMILFLLYIYIASGMDNIGLLLFYPSIIGLKNVKIKNVVKVMMWTLIIILLITIVLTVTKILPYSCYTKTDAFGNSYRMIKIANQHGNTLYVVIFNIIASYLYAYYDKINKKKLLIIELLAIITYFILYSRTGLILATLTILGTYIIKYVNIKLPDGIKKIKNFLERWSYVIFYLVVFIIGCFMKDTNLYIFLNKLVSSRISEVNHYLVDIGMKLIPQEVNYSWICDNTQVKIMVSYGLIFTIIYLLITYKTIKELQKRNKKIEIFMMVMYLLYSYSEVAFFKPISDFSMLFFVYAFASINCKDKENEIDDTKNKE